MWKSFRTTVYREGDTTLDRIIRAKSLLTQIGADGYEEETKLVLEILEDIECFEREKEQLVSESSEDREDSEISEETSIQFAFDFLAYDSSGREIEGTVEAESRKDAINQIRSMGYFPVKVQETK